MPIYMDLHIVPGVKAKDVAEAHQKDLLHQEDYGCTCMTYWVDEGRENVFCLIDAPNKEAVREMHSQAHGLIPNKIIEVNSELVASFLGRIYDPEMVEATGDGLKVFSDTGFRVLLVTQTIDPFLLHYSLGKEQANALLVRHNNIIRSNLAQHSGLEAEHEGSGFVISFKSASKALACGMAIQKEMGADDAKILEFKIGINAGDPVGKSNSLFGNTMQSAINLCGIAEDGQIIVASRVKELVSKDFLHDNAKQFLSLSPNDEKLLELLFGKLEEHWQDAGFDITEYCHATAMSTSQLYRQTIALTGLSPNILLKEFRLKKAKELMKKRNYSIAQITYDAGFSSASYFTKCFKSKYGLLPMAYIELLQ